MSSKRIAHDMMIANVTFAVQILQLIVEKKPIFANLSLARTRVVRKLRDLEKSGYVRKQRDQYILTERGKNLLSEEKIWSLTIPTPKKWDFRFRMVLYDIPIGKEKQRHAFRMKLRDLGFVMYQNSVWICPYPMEEIISVIADFYGIADYVVFAVVEKLVGEKRLRRQFNLS